MKAEIALGPVILDVAGLQLDATDRRRLLNPLVGGVILFARNFESPTQVLALTEEIRALRRPELLICVDHEGGRVQRFRHGFTAIPPMRRLGELWERDPAGAVRSAESVGRVIGTELSAHGVDLSFTPVLDLDYGASSVIGDRAFHAAPEVVGALGAALVRGLYSAGMGAVGKHFPGHGYAKADSHVAIPVDDRSLEEIMARDVAPYKPVIAAGLAGVMPAHEEGKITLPLIHTLRKCNDAEREVIAAVVEQDEMSLDDFRAVSGFVKKYGGIAYTVDAARFYINRCKIHLDRFEPSPVREALRSLSEYVVTRSK